MNADSRPPVRRRAAVLAVLVLVGLGILASEVLVRLLLPYNSPDTLRAYSLAYEGAVFARSRLAAQGRMVEVNSAKAWGGSAPDSTARTFYINDLGFRGPSFSPRKPPGTTRIIVVGGSSVFDQNVSDTAADVGQSWPNRAQSLLRGRGLQIEVINAGTPSHTSADALGRLISELWLYEPDVVLLYVGWNDIKSFRATGITPETPLASSVRPFDPTSDPYRYYRGWWDRLLAHSQLYVKFRNFYLVRMRTVGNEGYLPTGTVGSSYGPYGPAQYEQNLLNFVDIVRNMGSQPILATEATLVLNLDPGPADRIGAEYQLLDDEGLRRAYTEVYDITQRVATEKGVPVFDAARGLNREPGYFQDHVHLTPEGSEVIAQLLTDFLLQRLPTAPRS